MVTPGARDGIHFAHPSLGHALVAALEPDFALVQSNTLPIAIPSRTHCPRRVEQSSLHAP